MGAHEIDFGSSVSLTRPLDMGTACAKICGGDSAPATHGGAAVAPPPVPAGPSPEVIKKQKAEIAEKIHSFTEVLKEGVPCKTFDATSNKSNPGTLTVDPGLAVLSVCGQELKLKEVTSICFGPSFLNC